MKRVFVVGKSYMAGTPILEPITITRRTEKTIWCKNSFCKNYMLRIKKDHSGNEYAVDSSVPERLRDMVTYKA